MIENFACSLTFFERIKKIFFCSFSRKLPFFPLLSFANLPVHIVDSVFLDVYTLFSSTGRYDASADSTIKSSKKRKFSEGSDAGSGKGPDTISEAGNRQFNMDGPPQKKQKKKKV